ncbi:uncharacterized protein N0V89_012017 [Didymosphaeria variabile]|uniref:glutathione-specific gamma-glutamylcyclotransferase n=1 Tax=Didymosphaeria variabile TaxID=1932322 RepID=A0A9W8XAU3_9PLEO|nr:uncharacterized protein N0V89_012017 [Didymosphaeria variabile]KAJ4345881.1 hypothetical protein N0V89_012017 [Didymosphaeria variabile]
MADHEKQIEEFGKNDDFWLFGYGFESDMETAATFRYTFPPSTKGLHTERKPDERIPGYIEGYVRRFWQVRLRAALPSHIELTSSSEDHRGTPSAPGRVATLIDRAHWETLSDTHEPTERVWGAAYHIPKARVPEVREYLDIREINGYSIQFTNFVPSSDPEAPVNTLVYIGLPSNPQFLGPQDPEALAAHILKSKGPSGENREYLFQLEEALRGLGRGWGCAY